MQMRIFSTLIGLVSVCTPLAALDLKNAVVVTPQSLTVQEKTAVAVLVEEVQKRTQMRLAVQTAMPSNGTPAILVGTSAKLAGVAGTALGRMTAAPRGDDGFRVQVVDGNIVVAGNDTRGMLFGVGYLLRNLRMERGHILQVDDKLQTATAPRLKLRGHQLGYRPKVNAYDAFTVEMFDQYIRDLAIFGTNSIELIPPRSDDADQSPHFPLPKIEMMEEVSRICDRYGLDVWIWYPAMDKDYSDPATVEFALKEWEEVYRRLPRIDYIFVPGGDPGHTEPKYLFALLEKQTALLHKYHPKAQMWMSPQSFSQEWMEEFYGLMKAEPAWLGGIVYGPQIRDDIPTVAARIPKKYPIRHYPDITHSTQAQFAVPDWDVAYAVTEGREGPNPRPTQERDIFRRYMDIGIGFLTYSEGVNDDVNKFIWSGLGWDPDKPVIQILREFSRYFIGEQYKDSFAQGLMALERNWVGPLLTNENVDTTFQVFRDMERSASPQVKLNWRFQQALYRAYYDSYVRDRLIYETSLEKQAFEKLRAADRTGSQPAVQMAGEILGRATSAPASPDKRQRIFELAEALYQSIHAQLSVSKYQAIAVGRGANLDTVDAPVTNRMWLMDRFAEISKLTSEGARMKEIAAIVNWTDPGPGGFYDDLGNPSRQPHLVSGESYSSDPMFRRSPMTGFSIRGMGDVEGQDQSYVHYPLSWVTVAEGLYDFPVKLRYEGLDPNMLYKVRVVYAGDNARPKLRMVAGDRYEVHGWLQRPVPYKPLEFDIPTEAIANGVLNLSVFREPNAGGSGRGNSVAEIWLLRRQ
jgi:hypothetical protein